MTTYTSYSLQLAKSAHTALYNIIYLRARATTTDGSTDPLGPNDRRTRDITHTHTAYHIYNSMR